MDRKLVLQIACHNSRVETTRDASSNGRFLARRDNERRNPKRWKLTYAFTVARYLVEGLAPDSRVEKMVLVSGWLEQQPRRNAASRRAKRRTASGMERDGMPAACELHS